MHKAIVEGNYNDINRFYYFRICDSIQSLYMDPKIKNVSNQENPEQVKPNVKERKIISSEGNNK